MIRKFFFILIFVVLFACSPATQPATTPSEAIVLNPSATPMITPSVSPTEVLPTVSPVPTVDPNFFRDDFNGTLAESWSWLREDPLNWSLATVPGSLQINVDSGYVSAHRNSNLLLRAAPAGNFQIETQMVFRPQDNFQFAGLIIYESDADFIQAGHAFCKSFECVGEGLYMDAYKKGVAVKPDFGQPYKDSSPILLRLSRQGNTYTFEANADGKIWFVIGNHASDLHPLQIGLVTGQRVQGRVLPAIFDYFEVRSLP